MDREKDMNGAEAFAALFPNFYVAVRGFPDFRVEPGLSGAQINALETRLEIKLSNDLRSLFSACAAISMNGLSIKAAELGPILMPSSEALVIGEFYLRNDGDRLLMLPDDPAVYYLEQRNGAITRLAKNLDDFFENVLPRLL